MTIELKVLNDKIVEVSNNNTLLDMLMEFEKTLDEMNLVYEYSILKYDKDFVYYKITFNGTPNTFLNLMKNKDFDLNTQNKKWFLK